MASLFASTGTGKLFQGVDPSTTYDPNAALGQLQSMLGFTLDPGQVTEAGQIAGWDGAGSVSGAGLNRVFQEAAARTGGRYLEWGSNGGELPPLIPPTPTPTGPIIDPGGTGAPAPNGPPPPSAPGPIVNPGGSGAPAPNMLAPPPVDPLTIQTTPPTSATAQPAPIDPGGIGRSVPDGASAFQGVDPDRAFSPQEAIAILEQMAGRSLTPDEIAEAQAIAQYSSGDLGGDALNQLIQEAAARSNATFVPFNDAPIPGQPPPGPGAPTPPGTFTGVDPASTIDPSAAQAELERQIGRPLTPDEFTAALAILTSAGYSGSGPLTGAMFNLLLQEAVNRTPGSTFVPWGSGGPQPGPGPKPGPAPPPEPAGPPPDREPNTGDIPPEPNYGDGPLEGVGNDPLSTDIVGRLRDLLQYEGTTNFGDEVNSYLRDIIQRGGQLPDNLASQQFESARELAAKAERTLTGDLRAALADRNLLSEPGIAQGAEIGGQGRITQQVGEEFARAVRDIGIASGERSDARLSTALQLATGASADQATTLLQAIQGGTDRQAMLSDVALKTLAQNQAWSQFVAEFGLDRDKMLYDMESGNIAQYLPLLNLFIQLAQLSSRGYV